MLGVVTYGVLTGISDPMRYYISRIQQDWQDALRRIRRLQLLRLGHAARQQPVTTERPRKPCIVLGCCSRRQGALHWILGHVPQDLGLMSPSAVAFQTVLCHKR